MAIIFCSVFLQSRASCEANNWKLMQYWTDTPGTNPSL